MHASSSTGATPTTLLPAMGLTTLPGVGPTTAARLAAAGLSTVLDLVQFFPRRYSALQELPAPDEAALGNLVRLRGEVRSASLAWLPGRRAMVTVVFACADGAPFAAQFFNQPWLKKAYPAGQQRCVEGMLVKKGQRFLLQQVWGPQYERETNYLRVYMAQVRRKLEPDPSRPRYFITEPGMGYRFEAPPPTATTADD